MRRAFTIILFLLYLQCAYSQTTQQYDSIKYLISSAKDDSTKFYRTYDLIWAYMYSNIDSAAFYIRQNILLAKKMNSDAASDAVYGQYWTLEDINGNYSGALQYILQSLRSAEEKNNFISICQTCFSLSNVYSETGDFEKAIYYLRRAKSMLEPKVNPIIQQEKNEVIASRYIFCLVNFAQVFETFNRLDSALKYANDARDLYVRRYGNDHFFSHILPPVMGNIYSKKGDYAVALSYYRTGITIAGRDGVTKDVMDNYSGTANTFEKMGQFDSSIFYANKVLQLSEVVHNVLIKLDALSLLANVYKLKRNTDSVAKYLELTVETKDSLFNASKLIEMQNMTFNDELRRRELRDQEQQYQTQLRTYLLSGGLIVVLLVAGILYRNNRQKQRAKVKIESAYSDLKSAQAQLIQSEKMASLGELTAGIAHEIQNPLNFVNNFSDVNSELLEELKIEAEKGNLEGVKIIASDVVSNEQKINQHGKRADAIVKGMLQHSGTSSGQKGLTDINTLCDEYVRLAYHGLRAKDKSFNAEIKTNFDESIGKINIVPQDIGRVLLNLINNSFYAVNERAKLQSALGGYTPQVTVSTKKLNDKVEIIVKDNGNGIPQKILDKIFQPFFTTKPTGQGTGLGLSLAYDIVRAHGGDIKVNTKAHEGLSAGASAKAGTEFAIHLPVA